jgi:putative transcriptional regulator
MSFKEFREKRFGPKGPRFECHLRELREATGLTPEELAEHCKVSVETITLIEDAKYEPSVVLAEHLASYLRSSVESIFIAHPATLTRSAGFEERIRSQNWRVGFWCFYGIIVGSLIGAWVLTNYTNEQNAGIALFAIWGIGAIAYLIGVYLIPGFSRFTRQSNRAIAGRSKRNFWIAVIGCPILFAAFMEAFNVNQDHTWQRRILSFLFYAVGWGGWMYWVQYRKVKPKKDNN